MRTKHIALAFGLLIAGAALAVGLGTSSLRAGDHETTAEKATVETESCCLTGDCCCPGQGECCDKEVKAKAATSTVKYVKKEGAGCCFTGNCCCPGKGSCCGGTAAAADEGTPCCSGKPEKKTCCTK